MEWDDERTVLLIQEYEKRRLLWDQNHKHHLNPRRRKKLMSEIANILDTNRVEVKKTLNSLIKKCRHTNESLQKSRGNSEIEANESVNISEWLSRFRVLSKGQRPVIKWNNNKTKRLIREFKKRRLLWDKEHSHYRDRKLRIKYMKELASTIKVDVRNVRRRIRILSNLFWEENKKIQELKEKCITEGGKEECNWKWYKKLRFLSGKYKSTAAEWDDEKTKLLISEYEKRRLLWDKFHHNFYNKQQRNICMKEIAKIVNETTGQVKKKIKELLQTFRSAKEKLQELDEAVEGKDVEEVCLPKWFECFQFLSDVEENVDTFEWDDEKTALLIQEYKKRKMLWDKNDIHYKNNKIRRRHMYDLVNTLKISETEVRRKIKCLLGIFRDGTQRIQELKAKKETEGVKEVYKSKWFESLQFLSARIKHDESKPDWSDEKTILLIREYEKRRLLWDKSHQHYVNKNLRKKNMDEISNIVKEDVIEVRKKIDRFLVLFRNGYKRFQELQKEGKLQDDKEMQKLKWVENLQFLCKNYDEGENMEIINWNDETSILFIKEYKKRRLLWDTEHDDYKNDKIREKHLHEMSNLLNIDIDSIRKKIKRVLNIFREGKLKIENLKSKGDVEGLNEIYKSKWYANLEFLWERKERSKLNNFKPDWSDDKIVLLIQEYKKRRQLWDKSHKYYHNIKLRKKHMSEIGNVVGVNAIEVKKKIKYFLDLFRAGNKKLQELGDSEADKEVHKPKWFDCLQFLSEKQNEMKDQTIKKPVWSDEKTLLFIKEYQKRRLLWDKNHNDYKNSILRQQNLNELADILNEDVTTIKKKIKRMLNIFDEGTKKMQNFNKRRLRKDAKETYVSKWFPSLQFLTDKSRPVWKDDKTLLLIQEYEKRRLLWDKNHKQHNNGLLRRELFNELSNIVEVDVPEVKKKINTLSITFWRGIRKLRKLKGQEEVEDHSESFEPKWFDELKFLLDGSKSEHVDNKSVKAENADINKSHLDDGIDITMKCEAVLGSTEVDEKDDSIDDVTDASGIILLEPVNISNFSENADLQISSKRGDIFPWDGSCEDFGHHVAGRLREFAEKDRASVMHRISNVIYRAYMDSSNTIDDNSIVSTRGGFKTCLLTSAMNITQEK